MFFCISTLNNSAIFNNSGTWIQTPTETANTHPITRTIGGYTYQALSADATITTHTLLTNLTTHYMASDYGILPNNPNTWIPFSSTITKTIYDPCPYGYRVPINGSWAGFPTNKWTQYTITEGTTWTEEDGGWWPAAGSRSSNSTILYNIGDGGGYWSSSRYSAVHTTYNLGFNYNSWVNPSYNTYRSYGFSVRCIEEEENKQSKFLKECHCYFDSPILSLCHCGLRAAPDARSKSIGSLLTMPCKEEVGVANLPLHEVHWCYKSDG